MRASLREQAIVAVIACLAHGEDSPAKAVSRSRLDQIAASDLPCFDVSPGEERDDPSYGDHDAWGRELEIVVRALVDATDSDDSALDPLYAWAVQTVMADPSLGGTVDDIDWRGASPVFRPEGRDLIGLEIAFAVKFATKRGDPTRRG